MSEDFVKSNSMAVWGLESDDFVNNLKIKQIEEEIGNKIDSENIKKIENHFQEDYINEKNHKEKHMFFNTDWLGQLNTKRVIVRARPSKNEDGNNVPKDTLFAFHWYRKNCDYKLASALYDTKFWGGFITNLSNDTTKSTDSVNSSDAQRFLKRIDKDSRILVFGKNPFNAFKDLSYKNTTDNNSIIIDGHVITYIPDYDPRNIETKINNVNYWDTFKIHKRILESENVK